MVHVIGLAISRDIFRCKTHDCLSEVHQRSVQIPRQRVLPSRQRQAGDCLPILETRCTLPGCSDQAVRELVVTLCILTQELQEHHYAPLRCASTAASCWEEMTHRQPTRWVVEDVLRKNEAADECCRLSMSLRIGVPDEIDHLVKIILAKKIACCNRCRTAQSGGAHCWVSIMAPGHDPRTDVLNQGLDLLRHHGGVTPQQLFQGRKHSTACFGFTVTQSEVKVPSPLRVQKRLRANTCPTSKSFKAAPPDLWINVLCTATQECYTHGVASTDKGLGSMSCLVMLRRQGCESSRGPLYLGIADLHSSSAAELLQ
mmetsp:Transcript_101808/g.263709  ORF Transcript_101808/g.263709 Transcript_101808/m.263709 type:complete len:314 (-) Transcript_101808:128-1069(-)